MIVLSLILGYSKENIIFLALLKYPYRTKASLLLRIITQGHKLKFYLTIDNKEILKSLLYSLERKFQDVKFDYLEVEKAINTNCSSDETERKIQELVNFYNTSFKRMNNKINSKVAWVNDFPDSSFTNITFENFNSDLPGVQFLSSAHTELVNLLDETFKLFFIKLNGTEISVPSLISKKNLERCKYLAKDSHQISQLHSLISGETQACLSPAACLPLYPSLENAVFHNTTTAFTFKSAVYRYEGGVFSDSPLERNWEYQIREFVCFYSADEDKEIFEKYSSFMNYFCTIFKLPSKLQTASDTFFHEENSKMIAHQLMMSKKYETVYLSKENKEIALSSLNFHDASFTDEFSIKNSDRDSKSLCIGVGLFRVLKAILESNNNNTHECKILFETILHGLRNE